MERGNRYTLRMLAFILHFDIFKQVKSSSNTQSFGILTVVAYYSIRGGIHLKKKLLAAMFGAVLVLGACGGGDDKDKDDATTDTGSTDVASVDGEAVVNKSCVSCHGGNLDNGSAPAINKAGADFSEEELHDIIINGIGGMPPGIVKGEEAEAAAKWLSEQK